MIIFLHRRPDNGDGGAIVCKAAGTIARTIRQQCFLL